MPASMFAAHKLNIVDHPNPEFRGESSRHQKIHKNVIPRFGGFALVLGFFIALNWIELDLPATALYFSLGLFAIGVWDDITPTRASYRLLGQVVLCLGAIISANLTIPVIHIFGFDLKFISPLSTLLPLFILVGAINTINMIDGMDGLAGGISLIALTMMGFMLFLATSERWYFGLMSVSVGSILGFLKYNSHPAKIFMGDGGSNWLGYLTGLMLVLCLQYTGPMQDGGSISYIPLSSALLCIAVPVFDTLGVMIARVWNGYSPLRADHNHFHHFLMHLGFGQKKTVTIIYFVSLVLSTIGLFPIAYPQYQVAWIPDLTLVLVSAFLVLSKFQGPRSYIMEWLRQVNILEKKRLQGWKVKLAHLWETLHRYAVYIILSSGVLLPTNPTNELSLLSAGLAVAIIIGMFFGSQPSDFLKSLLVASAAALILATNNISPIQVSINQKIFDVQIFYNQYFVLLALSTAIYYAVTFNRMHLDVSPTDFLLIIIPLIMLVFPEPFQSKYRLGIISARAFVLFLCMRTFVLNHRGTMRRASMIATMSLIYIALKGLADFRFVIP